MRSLRVREVGPLLVMAAVAAIQIHSQDASRPAHAFFRVQAPPSDAPVSGRLLIFLKAGSGDKEVSTSEMQPADTWVCARELHDVAPGSAIVVDADEIAYPRPFSALPPGIYEAQAVLDVNHVYNYRGRVPQDWVSPVVTLAGWKPGVSAEPELSLERRVVEDPQHGAAYAKLKEAATSDVAQYEEFESPLLTRFWGHPVNIKAWVILPRTMPSKLRKSFRPRIGRMVSAETSMARWCTACASMNA